jgi:hypothetical protein
MTRPESERSQSRARRPVISLKNAAIAQTFGGLVDLVEHREAYSGRCPAHADVHVEFTELDEAGGKKEIHKPMKPVVADVFLPTAVFNC